LTKWTNVLARGTRVFRSLLSLSILVLFSSAAAGETAGASEPVESLEGDWRLHGRNSFEQRFSPLSQINRETVSRLGLAWTYETLSRRGLEATPLVIDGVLYATSTWSVVFALDAKTGRELWRHDPMVPREVGRKACCDVVNRGVAYYKGRIYFGAFDGRLIALDAKTGSLIWQVLTVPKDSDYTITGAPRIVRGRVIIGNGGGEYGVRGYFSAYDALTGERLWRFYTVPGPPAQPIEHVELALAAKTWSKDSDWASGLGGTVWDSMAYDPELDLLYVGVGNSSPYNRAVRSPGGGDNLFLTSILAVKPETGKLIWHYQTTPGEFWDYTATQHMILAELEIDGALRRVLMQAPKNGFFYILDRETGELLSAEKLGFISWASHVDLKTGRPVETGNADWSKDPKFVVPGPPGVHNWHPMSFSPKTGLVYVPTLDNAWLYQAVENYEHVPGNFNTGEDWPEFQESVKWTLPFCSPTHLTAWDPKLGRRIWRVEHDHPVNAGVLATAGDLVFQGNGAGFFAAYADDDGEKLWQAEVGVGIMAPPISYRIDGEQYIAVLAGLGGSPAMNRAEYRNENAGRVFAFKLDGAVPVPGIEPRTKPDTSAAAARRGVTPESIERGKELYSIHCGRCHGPWARSNGWLPDLRHATSAVHDAWESIVIGGAFKGKGMASFADQLNADDARAIQAFVIDRALVEDSFAERAQLWANEHLCIPASWLAD
jgi:quinohemoprotein ethanol dehydrogenase